MKTREKYWKRKAFKRQRKEEKKQSPQSLPFKKKLLRYTTITLICIGVIFIGLFTLGIVVRANGFDTM